MPALGEARGLRRASALLDRPLLRLGAEVLVLGIVLAGLTVLVFGDYLRGTASPGWDFLSHYNADAYAWWHDGSFFSPPQWVPYAWGGYPGVADLQNSSWYLPVGAASTLAPFDLRVSAVLSAAHVVFGACGMYALGRQWRLGHLTALVGAVAWFFVGGFYAHGSQLDIHRGYAWLPWVLMVISPMWPWRKWWAPLLAVPILWQTFLAMYPGAIIATSYGLIAWIVASQLTFRPRLRGYLLPLAGATALAATMALLRFLPYSLISGVGSPSKGDESVLSWSSLATLAYPYDKGEIPGDPTMKSLFIPVVVYALVFMLPLRAPVARITGAAAVTAVLLGVPNSPWSGLVDHLPGLGVSRFRFDDFKLVFFGALTLAAMAGLARAIEHGRAGQRAQGWRGLITAIPRWRVVGMTCFALAMLELGLQGPYVWREWVPQWLMLVAACAVVVCASLVRRREFQAVAMTVLLGVTVLSGFRSTQLSPAPWYQDRIALESLVGAPMQTLMAERVDPGSDQRPGRAAPTGEFNSFTEYEPRWSKGFYDGSLAVMGYVNLKGSPGFDVIRAQVLKPGEPSDILAFWAAPGMGIDAQRGMPSAAEIQECATAHACGGGLTVQQVAYEPQTPYVYDVDVPAAGATISFNEAYYNGWTATSCNAAGACAELAVAAGEFGEVTVEAPAGTSQITLAYHVPGLTTAWLLFGGATLALLGWVIVLHARRPRALPLAGEGALTPEERT